MAAVKIEPESSALLADPVDSHDNKPDEPLAVDEDSLDEDSLEEEPAVETAEAEPVVAEPPPPENRKHWYVVKVQSGREDTIKEAIERRVRKERLEEFYGQIVIPVEKVTEVKTDKNGKRVTQTKERKLYPGYLMCEVEYNDRILYLFRETSGVGDFVGAQPGNLDARRRRCRIAKSSGCSGRPSGQDEPKAAPPQPKFARSGRPGARGGRHLQRHGRRRQGRSWSR